VLLFLIHLLVIKRNSNLIHMRGSLTDTLCFHLALACAGKRRPHHPLTIKQEVAAILKGLRVQHELGRRTRDGLVTIDVALQAPGERYIALQVVMEHEHTCNTGQFLGPLQFQTQVLEMNGWEVRHVRAKDLKALKPASKPLFMADLVRSMGVRVPVARGGAAGAAAGGAAAAAAASGLDLVMQQGEQARPAGSRLRAVRR
jgi:hypothetical protein